MCNDFDYSTLGFEGVDVSYWWLSVLSDTEFGAELYFSTDFGITWTLIDGPLSFNNTWQQSNIDMQNAIDNLPNVRFAFVFSNTLENQFDENFIEPIGFGLDDFRLIADCEFELPEDYTVCSGETTTVNADTSWYNTFTWSTGSVSESVSLVINQDTTIYITATNEFCTVEDSINIFVQNERADLGLIVNGEINGVGIPCHGDCNGELQLEVINGTPENDGSYTVQWMDSIMNPINTGIENIVLNNFTSVLSGVCEGKYFVSVLDAICNIPELDSIVIISNDPITNTFTSDSTSCYNGADGMAMAFPSGGIAPYTYNWGFLENNNQYLVCQ